MSNQLRADTDQMRATVQALQQGSQTIQETYERARQAMSAMQNSPWSGQNRIRAEAFWQALETQFTPSFETINDIARRLLRTAEAYDEAARVFGGHEHAESPDHNSSDTNQGFSSPHNMQDLAKLIHDMTEPIQFVKIGDNEYLVLLQGTEGDWNRTNNWGSAIQSGAGVSSPYERQVRDLINAKIPPNATLHFAGHSQGGIIANNLADNQDFLDKYAVKTVTTFGSPESAPENPVVKYYRYASIGDPVPALVSGGIASFAIGSIFSPILLLQGLNKITNSYTKQIQVDTGKPGWQDDLRSFPNQHGEYHNAPGLTQAPLPFQINQWEWEDELSFSTMEKNSVSLIYNNLASGNTIRQAIGLIDTGAGITKTVVVGTIKHHIETISSDYPEPIRDAVDRYSDRVSDVIMTSPSVSEVVETVGDTINSQVDNISRKARNFVSGLFF